MANADIASYSPDAPRTGTGGRMTTRHRMILTLEMQGHTKTQIGEMLGSRPATISLITNRPAYIAAREELLKGYDRDFMNLKGKVMQTMDTALTPGTPMDQRLRAADMWFKAQGYGAGAYAGKPTASNDLGNVTAEDIVRELLKQAARPADAMETIDQEELECAAE